MPQFEPEIARPQQPVLTYDEMLRRMNAGSGTTHREDIMPISRRTLIASKTEETATITMGEERSS